MINPCSRIETKPRLYWLLFLLAMAVAPAMSAQTVRAYQDAQKILIENEEIRITFHSENGTIDSVIHKRSGVDLLSRKRGAWPSLWLIDTRSGSDGNGLIQIETDPIKLSTVAQFTPTPAERHAPRRRRERQREVYVENEPLVQIETHHTPQG